MTRTTTTTTTNSIYTAIKLAKESIDLIDFNTYFTSPYYNIIDLVDNLRSIYYNIPASSTIDRIAFLTVLTKGGFIDSDIYVPYFYMPSTAECIEAFEQVKHDMETGHISISFELGHSSDYDRQEITYVDFFSSRILKITSLEDELEDGDFDGCDDFDDAAELAELYDMMEYFS